MSRRVAWSVCLLILVVGLAGAGEIPPGAAWELRVLGVTDDQKLAEVRELAARRPVKMAIVGLDGISRQLLAPRLDRLVRLRYCQCARYPLCDPRKGTHDTGQAGVILDLTRALGIRVKLLSYQPPYSYPAIAEAFAQAAERADIVLTFMSFWGDGAKLITESIRRAENTLFISPYVQVGDRPTNTCPQGHAAQPWGEGIAHFITTAPLARKGHGRLLTSLDRGADVDTEIINFIVPSYYASGTGGTCPSAAVAAAAAAYIYAASPRKPDAEAAIELLRQTARLDRVVLTSIPEFGDEEIAALEADIQALIDPGPDKQRKLDAPGVINLYEVYRRLVAQGP